MRLVRVGLTGKKGYFERFYLETLHRQEKSDRMGMDRSITSFRIDLEKRSFEENDDHADENGTTLSRKGVRLSRRSRENVATLSADREWMFGPCRCSFLLPSEVDIYSVTL